MSSQDGEGTLERLLSDFHRELRSSKHEVRDGVARVLDELGAMGIEVYVRDEQLPLTPAVLPAAHADLLGESCRSIVAAIEELARSKFGLDPHRLIEFVRMRGVGRELSLCEAVPRNGDWALLARPDLVIAPGGIQILETNIVPNLGHFPEADVALRVIMGVPALARVLHGYGCRAFDSVGALAQTLRRHIPEIDQKLLALVEWDSYLARFGYVFHHLAVGLNQRGVRAVVCAAESLTVGDNGVFLGETRIDSIYRFFGPPEDGPEELLVQYERLLEAIYAGLVHVVGHLGQTLLGSKGYLALLSEELSDRLGPEVQKLVPWTRIVSDRRTSFEGQSIELLSFIEFHQDMLVIKGGLRSGGSGTAVGRDLTPAEWRARISAALTSDEQWIAQEWVRCEPQELAFMAGGELEFRRCQLDYGVFMFEHSFAGAVRRNTTRLAPRLTHAGQGGGAMPVLFMP